MDYRWMPVIGEFDVTSDSIVFRGRRVPPPPPTEPQTQPQPEFTPSVGILLSDLKMMNGRLRASISFDEITPYSICELIIGIDLRTKGQIVAGLGGSAGMFAIREWKPGVGSPQQAVGTWVNHEVTGDRVNLKPGVAYDVGVSVSGSNIRLDVDAVPVAAATVPSAAVRGHQVGIFCLNTAPITISRFSAEIERPKAFIVMQFSSPYNEVYSHVIKDVCDEFKVDPVRADEIYAPGIVIRDVIDRIAQSQVVIADISPANPNVYFEVGYALALGKPIILLAQCRAPDAPLPFDLSAFRVLFYDNSIEGKPKLELGLKNHLREILGKE